jgi:hypothetical protein
LDFRVVVSDLIVVDDEGSHGNFAQGRKTTPFSAALCFLFLGGLFPLISDLEKVCTDGVWPK